MNNRITKEPMLTNAEAADYVGLRPRTMEKFRQTGGGPVYLKLGRRVLYRQSDLDAWIRTCERSSTAA